MRGRSGLFLMMLILFPLRVAAEGGGVVAELIFFVEDNGRNALVYTTARSDIAGYSLQMRASESDLADQNQFLYIHPEEREWQRSETPGYQKLTLPKGDFATLRRVDLNRGQTLQVGEDGLHTFVTPTMPGGGSDGYQGVWSSPNGFESITYTWIFPEVFEPVSYKSNQPGDWVRRYNTVTYYGKNVNNLVFEMTYRSRLNELYGKLKKMFGDEDKIEVTEDAGGIRLSIEATLLYPSGVADLSSKGRGVLGRVSGALMEHKSVRVIVEGHTDTDRIGETLAQRYPTNWELSAARSINVIRYLIEKGIEEPRFEGRAFSSTKPVASNESAEGKAKNRRIEILLSKG